MHRFITSTLALLLIAVSATAYQSGDFAYDHNGIEATLTGYSGVEDVVEVPAELGGYPVTMIAAEAFADCPDLTTVVCPTTVVSLGANLFDGSLKVRRLYFQGDAPDFDPDAFAGAEGLHSIYYRNGQNGWDGETWNSEPRLKLWTYRLSLRGEGGSVSEASIDYPAGETYGELATVTRANYTFAGWFTQEGGQGDAVTAADTAPLAIDNHTLTLYAAWEPTPAAVPPAIRSFTMTEQGQPRIVIDGYPPLNATIEAAASLTSTEWNAVTSIFDHVTSSAYIDLTDPTPDQHFYRIAETSAVPLYLAIDVSGGTGAASYPVTYYNRRADVPGDITNDVYKTDQILLRRIPAGTFVMGSPEDELGRRADREDPRHEVTLTKDYYIGVFEIIQRQWELVMGNRPSWFNNATHYARRPVESVSYRDIREAPNNVAILPTWPESSQVHAESFMGRLRSKTGLTGFDLPTESQWEYACRAGTTTALNSGVNLDYIDEDPKMDAVGRYMYNSGAWDASYTRNSDASKATAIAGSYLPNAWGLYDMHGNVLEICLDWYGIYPNSSVVDPKGVSSIAGTERVARGGSFTESWKAGSCRSAHRKSDTYHTSRYRNVGFRLTLHLQ